MGHRKFQSLLATVEEHWTALEFDLLGKVYLPGVWTGQTSWRVVAGAVENLLLDHSSALSRAARNKIRESLPVDPDPERGPMTERDVTKTILATENGPTWLLLRSVEHNQRMQMWLDAGGEKTGQPAPEPIALAGDVLDRVHAAEMSSMNSATARAYLASMEPSS